MIRFEKTVLERKPDVVLVYGDVNSTVAATLVCAKLGTKLAHVEAGLRSYDRTMPEEINRLVTDQLADLLLIPSEEAEGNLLREGIAREKIHFVGNVMIDTLKALLPQARMPDVPGLGDKFALVTLHRPSNVDEPGNIETHSRDTDESLGTTANRLSNSSTNSGTNQESGLPLRELKSHLHDSSDRVSGVSGPAAKGHCGCDRFGWTAGRDHRLGRSLPDRPGKHGTAHTITHGTNTLVGTDMDLLTREVGQILSGQGKGGRVPPLWTDLHPSESRTFSFRRMPSQSAVPPDASGPQVPSNPQDFRSCKYPASRRCSDISARNG